MDCHPQELLISVITEIIAGDHHVAVGAASPIPGCAALLAQLEAKHRMDVTILHSRRENRFTDGARELFDIASQGRIDTFFLGGVQIDGAANINLVRIGKKAETGRRFAGSFGSALMYFVVPKVILFREEHSPRTLVEKVDFISAPGTSPKNVYRPGGPYGLVTGRAVFLFDRKAGRFKLISLHPGQTLEKVIDATGFKFDYSNSVPQTPLPTPARLSLLRQTVAPKVYKFYPEFTKRLYPDIGAQLGDGS
jgi:glutaconate CoA-transferase subunit B